MSQHLVDAERYLLQVELPPETGQAERHHVAERLRLCATDLSADLPGLAVRIDLTRGGRPTLRRVGPITLDDDSCRVIVGERAITLAHKEFLILRLLVSRSGQVVTRGEIVAALRVGGGQPARRTVDVHVHRVRAKLGRDGECIVTVRGEGYRFNDSAHVVVVG